MRVVLDCNVLVSAARIDGTCRAVIDASVRWHDIILSEPILAEDEADAVSSPAAEPAEAPLPSS